MENLVFKCPKCGGNKLEEVMVNVVVVSELKEIVLEKDVITVFHGEQTNEDGEVDRYQCVNCGYALEFVVEEEELWPVMDLEDLAKWFEQNKG